MKHLITLILLACTLGINAAKPQKTSATQLIERMQKLQKRGIMYGHQDDPFYGITWEWDFGRSDTRDLLGDYPAVMGFDLGGIEVGDAKDLDSVPFSQIRQQIQDHHRRGGIITISWHPRNPLIGTTSWIGNDTTAYNAAVDNLRKIGQCHLACQTTDPKGTVRSILPGGSEYNKFQLWLHRVSDFLLSLRDDRGQLIPVIFRPWHENNGSWFWWGKGNCSREEYLALWNMTQDFIATRLPHNLMWAFSPNLQGNWTEAEWLSYYPGDDRIDLIGVDAYQWGSEDDFVRQVSADFEVIGKIAREHGKLLALTEGGMKNSPVSDWWTRVLAPVLERHGVSYILPWRNYKLEHFGAAPGIPTANDFKQWHASKKLLLLNEIKK